MEGWMTARLGNDQLRKRGTTHALIGATMTVASFGTAAAAATPAPVITTQPAAQVERVGQRAGFNVVATGATAYQWYMAIPDKAGKLAAPVAIPGATNPFLITTPMTATQGNREFIVVAKNASGSTVSQGAMLTIGPNEDGSPPDSFWGNLATLPAPTGQAMTVKFVNATGGAVPDTEIFWSLQATTSTGQKINELHSLAEEPIYNMPVVGGTRLYFYIASDKTLVGTGAQNYFDFMEVNVGLNNPSQTWFNGDTTRVDAWGLPHAFRLQCGDGTLVERGEDYGTLLEPRQVTFLKYQAELGAPWSAAAQTQWPYRIGEPGGAGFGQGGPYASYFTSYINQVWAASGLTIPKPTDFLNLATQLPDLSAALNRHVAEVPGSFKPNGTLANTNFWQLHLPATFYQTLPANLYARFWHERAIANMQYAFPYDDDDSQSSDVGCVEPKSLVIAIAL
jgi:hypothetical protein